MINNKSIVIIKYPVTQEYLSAIESKGINITEFYSNIIKQLDKFGSIDILDYQEKFKDNYSLFSDPDHLNYLGAKIFSKELSNDLKNLGLTD